MASAPIDLNELNLNLGRGQFIAPAALHAEINRELKDEDLLVLATTKVGSTTKPLNKIRGVHHQVARLLASGMKQVDISAAVGISMSRISILKNDPAFQELIAHYAENEFQAFLSVREKMENLGLEAAGELHERLLENPEELGNGTLIQIMTTALDRGGHSPVHKSQNMTTVLSQEEIKALKETAAHGGTIIQKEVEHVLQKNSGDQVGQTIEGEAEVYSTSEGKEGSESKGADL